MLDVDGTNRLWIIMQLPIVGFFNENHGLVTIKSIQNHHFLGLIHKLIVISRKNWCINEIFFAARR